MHLTAALAHFLHYVDEEIEVQTNSVTSPKSLNPLVVEFLGIFFPINKPLN